MRMCIQAMHLKFKIELRRQLLCKGLPRMTTETVRTTVVIHMGALVCDHMMPIMRSQLNPMFEDILFPLERGASGLP